MVKVSNVRKNTMPVKQKFRKEMELLGLFVSPERYRLLSAITLIQNKGNELLDLRRKKEERPLIR
jgi:hypothetical protein